MITKTLTFSYWLGSEIRWPERISENNDVIWINSWIDSICLSFWIDNAGEQVINTTALSRVRDQISQRQFYYSPEDLAVGHEKGKPGQSTVSALEEPVVRKLKLLGNPGDIFPNGYTLEDIWVRFDSKHDPEPIITYSLLDPDRHSVEYGQEEAAKILTAKNPKLMGLFTGPAVIKTTTGT